MKTALIIIVCIVGLILLARYSKSFLTRWIKNNSVWGFNKYGFLTLRVGSFYFVFSNLHIPMVRTTMEDFTPFFEDTAKRLSEYTRDRIANRHSWLALRKWQYLEKIDDTKKIYQFRF